MPYVEGKMRIALLPVSQTLEDRIRRMNGDREEIDLASIQVVLLHFLQALDGDRGIGLEPMLDAVGEFNRGAGDKKRGALNYLLCSVVWRMYLRPSFSYTRLDEVIEMFDGLIAHTYHNRGSLRCAQLEIYRRLGGPYEDRKIDENGDVFNF